SAGGDTLARLRALPQARSPAVRERGFISKLARASSMLTSRDTTYRGESDAEPASADRGSPPGHGRGQSAADRGNDPGRGARADGGDGARPQGRAAAGRPGGGAGDVRPGRADPSAPLLAKRRRLGPGAGDRLLPWRR